MRGLFFEAMQRVDLGILPSIGLVLLFLTLSAIFVWTYLPSKKQAWDKIAKSAMNER